MSVTVRMVLGDKRLKGVVYVGPEVSVYNALIMMRQHNIGLIVVMLKGSCCPLGVFTHKDNSLRVTLEGLDPKTTPISKVMTPPEFRTITTDATLLDCIFLMADGINHLLVVEGEGEYMKPLGVISNKDVERELLERGAHVAFDLETVRANQR